LLGAQDLLFSVFVYEFPEAWIITLGTGKGETYDFE
jgi:hypothetical protein